MMTEYLYTRPTFMEMEDGVLVNLRYVKSIRRLRKISIIFEVDGEKRNYIKTYPNEEVRDMMFEGFVQSIGKREINNNNNG